MGKVSLLNSREAAEYRGVTLRQVQRLAKAGVWPVAEFTEKGHSLFKKGDIRYAPTSLR